MTDKREPPIDDRPPDMPNPDDPAIFVDTPERDPVRGSQHLVFVLIALVIMVVVWWGL